MEVVLTFKQVECGRRIASFHDFFFPHDCRSRFFQNEINNSTILSIHPSFSPLNFIVGGVLSSAHQSYCLIIVPMCRRNDVLECFDALHS